MTNRLITDGQSLEDSFRILKASTTHDRAALSQLKIDQHRKVRKFNASSNPYMAGGAHDVVGIAPEYHIPQLENSSLELPRNRQEIINWCDYYYQTNELIGAAVDIHATLSVSDFSISCSDPSLKEDYEEVLEKINYLELLFEIANEYYRVGNVFPMGLWNSDDNSWTEFVLMPTLLIDLKKTLFSREPLIFLLPSQQVQETFKDENLKADLEQIPSEHRESLTQGKPILLDANRVSHISTKSIAGTLWGVPPVYRCFKTMVYSDKLYRAQEAIADGHITPLRIISLVTQDGLPVTPEEEENFRNQLVESSFDPNFIILTSGQVKDSYIGSSGRIINTNQEMDMIEKKITSGMKINKALLHGEGPTYSNAQVYQSQMNLYYSHFRTRLGNWLKAKVFKPIAEARGYYTPTKSTESSVLSTSKSTKKLLLPDIVWKGSNTLDSQTMALMKDLWNSKKISSETYFSIVVPDIDFEVEKGKVLAEAQATMVVEEKSQPLSQELKTPFDIDQSDSEDADIVQKAKSGKPQDQPLKVVKHSNTMNRLTKKYSEE